MTSPLPSYRQALADKIRNWRVSPADANGSAADPTWQFVDMVVEFMKCVKPADVVHLVNEGAIPKQHSLYGSPITLAAEYGLSALIKPLHEAGCPVNVKGKEGMTALEYAISHGGQQYGSAAAIRELLDLDATMSDGGSALRYASYCGHPHNVLALLDRGHDPNQICPETKETPLITAIWNIESGAHIVQTVKVLLEGGADPNLSQTITAYDDKVKRETQSTELPINALIRTDTSELSRHDLEELIDLMLEKGLLINHDRHDLPHPLAVCISEHSDTIAVALLRRGANPLFATHFYKDGISQNDIDRVEKDGTHSAAHKTAFQRFAQSGMPQTVAFLIEHHHEDPAQALFDGTPLTKTVFDPETKSVLLAAITQKQVIDAIGVPDDALAPAKPRSTLSL